MAETKRNIDIVRELVKDIPTEDLKLIFGSGYTTAFAIEKDYILEDIVELLQLYNSTVDTIFEAIKTGTILSFEQDERKWVVTCIYTDNTVDLVSYDGKVERKNISVYKHMESFSLHGKLETEIED